MKNIYKVIGMFVLVLFTLSCEEELIKFDGEAVAHFTKGSSGSFQAQENTDTYTIEVGTTTSAAASVTLEIDASSTAAEGVHFSAFTKSLSIGAGEYVTTFSINPIVENITPGSPVTLVINIANSGAGEEGYAGLPVSYTLKIERLCPSAIAEGTYLETGTGVGDAVTLTALGDGKYRFSNMNFDYYNPAYGDIFGEFIDVCNELTLLGTATSVFGIAWVGSGSYDPATGNITLAVADATYNPGYVVNMVFEYQP